MTGRAIVPRARSCLNGDVNRTVPSGPRHLGVRGAAESVDPPDRAEPIGRPLAPVPVAGLISPIRRKVGFELELKLDLRKGRITTEPEAPKKKKKKPKEQFLTWRSNDDRPDESSRLLTKEPIEIETSGPKERLELAQDQDIKKGETILPGAGWRLTPDGTQGDWYPEFITDAVDEDKQPTRPADIMGGVTDFVEKNWSTIVPGRYLQLPGGFVVGKPGMAPRALDLGANIHFTIGVRPDRVLPLMALLAKAKSGPVSEKDIVETGLLFEDIEPLDAEATSLLAIDESTRAILQTAVEAGGKATGDAIYRGVVALMGSYIAGELRILMSADQIVDGLSKRLRYCIEGKNLQEFLLTGDITDPESRQFIKQKYAGWDEFSADLLDALEGSGPGAAKLQVPVLSRSSLAKLRGKTTIASYPAFLTDVTAAAGLTLNQSQFPLFPLGISDPKRTRTVEAEPDISVADWVKSVFDGENLTFTDEVKSFEKVGPSVPGCLCWCETRAKGAVLEIRALDANRRVPPRFWPDLANEVVAMMRELNDD